jgi:dienelactone hydrolase
MTKHFCRGSFCGPSGPWVWPQVDGLTTRNRFPSAAIGVLLFLVVVSTVPPVVTPAEGQTGRIELHTLQTVTLTESQFLTGAKDGESAIIAAELRLPRGAADRLPAVVLLHGAGGIDANTDPWARELNEIGVAALIIDSFTGRGIGEGPDTAGRASHLTMIGDAYRALELLSRHPRIDPARIAVMGFSRGGAAALYASLRRFQHMHGPPGMEFAAYLPFYAPCWITYIDDEQVSDRPIRLFHGAADDWTPVEPCRQYVARLHRLGKDVQLMEYPGAHHGFDMPWPLQHFSAYKGLGTCALEERPDGKIVNRDTGQPWHPSDACTTDGVTAGADPRADVEAVRAVKEFLIATFKLSR